MKDSQNRNAFFYIIKSKANISIIEKNLEKLLKKGKLYVLYIGLKLDEYDHYSGHYPLTYAVSKNMENVAKLLLDYKDNPDHQNQKDGILLVLICI